MSIPGPWTPTIPNASPLSPAAVMGVGVGMTRDCSTLMVAQYFKRRREFVEIFIVSGSGLGIAIMSSFIKTTIHSIGWRYSLMKINRSLSGSRDNRHPKLTLGLRLFICFADWACKR